MSEPRPRTMRGSPGRAVEVPDAEAEDTMRRRWSRAPGPLPPSGGHGATGLGGPCRDLEIGTFR
eukprot:4358524-Prymnesium_polylepis.1